MDEGVPEEGVVAVGRILRRVEAMIGFLFGWEVQVLGEEFEFADVCVGISHGVERNLVILLHDIRLATAGNAFLYSMDSQSMCVIARSI